ncbi:MAG: type I-E CRISPR-associated protein Cas5/CasD [Anaerolineae bacterium]|nr:type I-E CRISPR-associated protein Cas5/CasD [Anaerolineae bacterium]
MATLLMRISAPLQSWGTQGRFTHRDTEREPSKSGIIGLLCAAQGRPREADIADLRALRMGVRVDRPGEIICDFHTAGTDGIYLVEGKVNRRNVIVSERYYLADAKFLVGLEGEPKLLHELQDALKRPTWTLFFGRKSCPPAQRIWLPDGLQDTDLDSALSAYPSLDAYGPPRQRLRLLIEDDTGEIVRNDQPMSFATRYFIRRRLRTLSVSNPAYETEA